MLINCVESYNAINSQTCFLTMSDCTVLSNKSEHKRVSFPLEKAIIFKSRLITAAKTDNVKQR